MQSISGFLHGPKNVAVNVTINDQSKIISDGYFQFFNFIHGSRFAVQVSHSKNLTCKIFDGQGIVDYDIKNVAIVCEFSIFFLFLLY